MGDLPCSLKGKFYSLDKEMHTDAHKHTQHCLLLHHQVQKNANFEMEERNQRCDYV